MFLVMISPMPAKTELTVHVVHDRLIGCMLNPCTYSEAKFGCMNNLWVCSVTTWFQTPHFHMDQTWWFFELKKTALMN